MWPFRRRPEETYNETLLREAGLASGTELGPGVEPLEPAPLAGLEPPALGFGARPRQSDVFVPVHAPDIPGNSVEFAALDNGDLIVDVGPIDADLTPLADAVEKQLERPYRAKAQRQGDGFWAVAANQIELARFAFDEGDTLDLVVRDGEADLSVDGAPSAARIPELEQVAEAHGDEVAVHAERLDGDVWELQAAQL